MKIGYVNPVCDLDAMAQMDAQLIRYTGCQVTTEGAIVPTNEVTTNLTSEPGPGSTILPGDQMPISTSPTPENGDGGLQSWFEKNKYLVIGGGLLLFFLLSKKRR